MFKNKSGFRIYSTLVALCRARYYAGKHSKRGYNFAIYQNSGAWRLCTVNNAVVKYRDYCTQFGIKKPYSNLRITARNKTGKSCAFMLRRTWGFYGFNDHSVLLTCFSNLGIKVSLSTVAIFLKYTLPDIFVASKSSLGTVKVYYNCFHELVHASHQTKVGSAYRVKYINYIYTYGKLNGGSYGDGTGKNAGLCALSEAWGYYTGYRLCLEEFKDIQTSGDNSLIEWVGIESFCPKKTGSEEDDIESDGTPIFRLDSLRHNV